MGHVTRSLKKALHGHLIAGTKEAFGVSAQKRAAKKAQRNVINSANEVYADQRRRQRAAGSSLATGATASGTAPTSSAMAYGLPTLGA